MSNPEQTNPYELARHIVEYKRLELLDKSEEAQAIFEPFLHHLKDRYGDRVFMSPLLHEKGFFTLPIAIQETKRKLFSGSVQCMLRITLSFDGRIIRIKSECSFERERESVPNVKLSNILISKLSVADAFSLEKFEKSLATQIATFQNEVDRNEILTFDWSKGFPDWD